VSDYRGHMAAGAAFYGILAFVIIVVPALAGIRGVEIFLNWWEIPAQLVVAVLAALWPDVDITSKGRKLFYRLFLVLDLYLVFSGAWQAAAFLGFLAILPGIGRHRGWTHKLWAAILVPLMILVVPLFFHDGRFIFENMRVMSREDLRVLVPVVPYYLAAVVGYISHLAADGLLGRNIGRLMSVLLWPVRMASRSASENKRNRGVYGGT
jgi:hypothetical protein